MSLDKAIEHKKEHRKKYYGAKAVSKHCRNHGGCPYCENNRLYNYKKKQEIAKDKIKEALSISLGDSDV